MRLFKILLVFVFTVTFVYAANVDAILNRHLEARGGAKAFGDINSFRVTGTMKTPLIESTFELIYKYPNRIKNTIRDTSGASVYIVNGQKAVYKNAHRKDFIAQHMPETMKINFIERSDFIEGALVNSKAKGIKPSYINKAVVDNRMAYLIKLNYYYGKEEIACIDATTYEHYKTYVDKDSIRVEMLLNDYREESGIMIPFHRISKLNGDVIEEVIINKVEINPEINDIVFEDMN
jgi:outer membrane lipoprotein-sorting protein